MVHSRLRRLARLTVDLLSLNFADSIVTSRSALFIPRGHSISVSPGLRSSAFSGLAGNGFSATRSSQHRVRPSGRRYLASTGLLLALSLEACGCNPVGDSSLIFRPFDSTGREADRVDQALSFYDPADQNPPARSSLPEIGTLSLEPRPAIIAARSTPWAIPESVYLIYRSRRPGEATPRQPALATAFVVSVPASGRGTRDPNHLARFLVTARHVVDPQWAHCAEPNPASIDLRLNRRTGGVGYETIDLAVRRERRIFTPSDTTADLAVIPLDNTLIAHLDDYKFLDLPFRILPSASDIALLRLDQPVMTAGLSSLQGGQPTSFPVFDAGSLSTMSDETVDVRCGQTQARAPQAPVKMLHVWFINAGVPQNVSGAPVFTSIARGPDSVRTPILLGVQSVAWPDKGVAGITPSPVLGELIQAALRESSLSPGLYKDTGP